MDELRTVLELATQEELQDITAILFSRKFNPLDYVHTPEPVMVQSQNRQAWLDTLESRFRFLAADGITVLRKRTEQVTYRQALIQVCKHLKISYYEELSTVDLEAEVFLHLLGKVWRKLPRQQRQKNFFSNTVSTNNVRFTQFRVTIVAYRFSGIDFQSW